MTLKVIGAGFGRTGTTTLKSALETLLGGKCHHMREVIEHPEQTHGWAAKARGEAVDVAALLDGYVACVDWPAMPYWAELAERFPAAKVLLSVRDFDRWYESTFETIYQLWVTVQRPPMSWLARVNPRMREFPGMLTDSIWGARGTFGGRFTDKEHVRGIYERHTAEVKRTIPEGRLLVYSPSEGWEPLCRFLGVPVPSGPMPHENERRELVRVRRVMTAVAWATAPITGPLALGMRALGR